MPQLDALKEELETFEKQREELLGRAENKFVLIKGSEVLGVYDVESDAIRSGYSTLGNVPFLVKQVVAVDVPERYVSNLLAI